MVTNGTIDHVAMQAKKLETLAGHMKDAWLHALIPLVPGDETFLKMARYLDNTGAFDDAFETPYMVLRNSVDRALDVRDEGGSPLRDYQFKNTGFVSQLQGVLLKGLADASECFN